jgi:hypothetical protein
LYTFPATAVNGDFHKAKVTDLSRQNGRTRIELIHCFYERKRRVRSTG